MGWLKTDVDSPLQDALERGEKVRLKVEEPTMFDREKYSGVRRLTLRGFVKNAKGKAVATLEYTDGRVEDAPVEIGYVEGALHRDVVSLLTTFS